MMVNQEGSWPFRCICYLSDISALEISDIITAPCVPFIAAAILFDNLLSLSFPVYNHHTTFSCCVLYGFWGRGYWWSRCLVWQCPENNKSVGKMWCKSQVVHNIFSYNVTGECKLCSEVVQTSWSFNAVRSVHVAESLFVWFYYFLQGRNKLENCHVNIPCHIVLELR